MGPRIMDHQIVSHIDLRKFPVNGKLIIILAQGTGHIVYVILRCIFLSEHRDMMVCPVHSGTHEICRTCIDSDIFLVDMLLMDRLCHQMAIRRQHKPAGFGENADISHARRNQYFLIYLTDTFTDHLDIISLLIGLIRNPDPSGKIDKGKLHACLLFDLNHKAEQNPRQGRIVIIGHGIACQKCVNTEFLRSVRRQITVRLHQLILGHTVLGVSGIIHYGI